MGQYEPCKSTTLLVLYYRFGTTTQNCYTLLHYRTLVSQRIRAKHVDFTHHINTSQICVQLCVMCIHLKAYCHS